MGENLAISRKLGLEWFVPECLVTILFTPAPVALNWYMPAGNMGKAMILNPLPFMLTRATNLQDSYISPNTQQGFDTMLTRNVSYRPKRHPVRHSET